MINDYLKKQKGPLVRSEEFGDFTDGVAEADEMADDLEQRLDELQNG